MPGRNQMGPNGAGPRTGRSLGPCGRGAGRGFGRRNLFRDEVSALSKEEQKKVLEQQKKEIEERLEELNK